MTSAEFETLQDLRCGMPEPTWVPNPVLRFIWPDDFQDFNLASADFDPSVVSSKLKTGTLARMRFVESGVSYFAWTLDGITPVFPVPRG